MRTVNAEMNWNLSVRVGELRTSDLAIARPRKPDGD